MAYREIAPSIASRYPHSGFGEALRDEWRPKGAMADRVCVRSWWPVEFDDRPGPVRDALAQMVRAWHAALQRAIEQAVEQGHLRADTDATQMLFEVHGLILALHHDARFLRIPGALDRARTGFERILMHYSAGAVPALAAAPAVPLRRAKR